MAMYRDTARVSDRSPIRPSARRILVVEDSPTMQRAVVTRLEAEGYEVSTASSGEEAIKLVFEAPFDLVVSDVTMHTITGVQLCRILRDDPATAGIPILLLSGDDDPRSRFWGRKAGADHYLSKRDALRLVEVVRGLLEGRPLRSPFVEAGTDRPPIDRLSRVLDQHLFEAVVASEVQRLMDVVHDRLRFGESLLKLVADVVSCPYIVLFLQGPGGPTYCVYARGPWPVGEPEVAATLVALEPGTKLDVEIVHPAGSWLGEPNAIEVGEVATIPVRVRGERLAELRLFSGMRPMAQEDVDTTKIIAKAIGPLAKSLFLMEETRLLALTDGLTGLYNRRHVADRLARELERFARRGTPLCVAICDIDHFKRINDHYGHNVGDNVLRAVSNVLRSSVPRTDIVGRWGGEEFLVILPESTLATARVVAERLRLGLEHAADGLDGDVHVTASIGVALATAEMNTDQLLEAADRALYRAKSGGRNRVEMA